MTHDSKSRESTLLGFFWNVEKSRLFFSKESTLFEKILDAFFQFSTCQIADKCKKKASKENYCCCPEQGLTDGNSHYIITQF